MGLPRDKPTQDAGRTREKPVNHELEASYLQAFRVGAELFTSLSSRSRMIYKPFESEANDLQAFWVGADWFTSLSSRSRMIYKLLESEPNDLQALRFGAEWFTSLQSVLPRSRVGLLRR